MDAAVSTGQDRYTQAGSSRAVDPFSVTLSRHGLTLTRIPAVTLQINVGLLCNQACRHCHLEAGPHRAELMHQETIRQVKAFALRGAFRVIDITGGATELNPHLPDLIESLAPRAETIMIRSNLTALADGRHDPLLEVCTHHRVVIVASFPSVNATQVNAQRGAGILDSSVAAMKKLNAMGYGRPYSGLKLDLVSNPTGAFLPPPQEKLEKKFRYDLTRKWGLVFNNLFTFANVPLGRFHQWLEHSGNYESYMCKLASRFNPCTVKGLMCRSLISVSWDGYVYDCDFNQAAGLPLGGIRRHITELDAPPEPGTPVAVADHCYACTAGSGFT